MATSAQKKSKASGSTENIDPDDLLKMLQTLLNRVDELPGIEARITNIHYEGTQMAAIILEGCVMDDVGNIRLA